MRKTFAYIDLAVYRANVRALRAELGPTVRLMAVVKANAYGHGLIEIARAAQQAGAEALAVALVEEGVALRQAGIRLPILVLSGLSADGCLQAVENNLILTAHTVEHLQDAQAAARALGREAQVHIKLDTGMNRIGVKTAGELKTLLAGLEGMSGVRLSGAFTHFASADKPDPGESERQLARFHEMVRLLPEGLTLHASGSSALLRWPEARFDMVRAGIALYGYPPVRTALPLRPVLSWVAEVTHVKEIAPGEAVSYGATFTATEHMKVATLAVGYGDGYSRLLSNRARVLINGSRCEVLGRVCMDMIMVDVSRAGEVKPGDSATLIGRDGGEAITAMDLADLAGTISYETLLSISPRVPRIYLNTQMGEEEVDHQEN